MPWFSRSLGKAEKDSAELLIRHLQKMWAYQQLSMEIYNDAFALAAGVPPPSGEALGGRQAATFANPAAASQHVIPALERKIGVIRSMTEQHEQASQLVTKNSRQSYNDTASALRLMLDRAHLQHEGFTSWIQNPALDVETTRLDGPESAAVDRALRSLNTLIKRVGITADDWMEINRGAFNEVRAADGLQPLDHESFRSTYFDLLNGERVRFFEGDDTTTGQETSERDDIDTLEPLAQAVFGASMESAQAIQDSWEERTGQAELPLKSNWAIRVEQLGFFLHMVNRLAFRVGGDDVRARVQDHLTIRLVNSLVDTAWDTSHASQGFDSAEWSGRAKQEVLDVINGAEMEYSECATMLELPFDVPRGATTAPAEFLAPDESDATGRLGRRIAEDTGQVDHPKLRELVWGATVSAATSRQIVSQVSAAIEAMRR